MNEYTPDKWVVIKLTNKHNAMHYRVFACWYGGFAGSDSWQILPHLFLLKRQVVKLFVGCSGATSYMG